MKRITSILTILIFAAAVIMAVRIPCAYAAGPASYSVTFAANGGSGSMTAVTVSDPEGDGEDYRLPACGFSAPEGKDFDCWKSGSTTYAPNQTVRLTAGMTFKAQWKDHVHKYKWKTTVKATYFKAGKKKGTCSCGAVKTKKVSRRKAYKKWAKNKENGKWYYFGKDGKKYKGWHKVKARKTGIVKWHYFTSKGVYKKSVSRYTRNRWVRVGSKKFYFTGKCRPARKGFNFIGNKLYHMDKYGAVMHGKFKGVDGKKYYTGSSGEITGIPYYKHKYTEFVIIDISEQKLRFYRSGDLKLSTDVVTGHRNLHDTPTGIFSVRNKARNIYLNGPTWSSFVNYWIAFIGGSHGMHDASWRSSAEFSNHRTYLYNGSHGCVNMRYSAARQLYNLVSIGTPVIVQR